MGATGFQQASTQIKKKTSTSGLSQIHLLMYKADFWFYISSLPKFEWAAKTKQNENLAK